MCPVSAVEARGLQLRYGPIVALAASSFTIPDNVVAALIGPNGSGKSTLLNAISGLKEPVAGELRVLGASPAQTRPRVAYVLQSTKVNESMPVTVREVVEMGRFTSIGPLRRFRPVDREAVATALDRLDIIDLQGRHLHELSGGERQRVFVAQGLAQEHDLLLMDEPLTGLDVVSAGAIEAVIAEEKAAGRTVIVTTHDLGEAAAADFVVLLNRVVVAAGSPHETITAEHLAAAYGPRLVRLADGGHFVDDPAHQPVPGRHVHLERTVHPEAPGSDMHRPGR